MSMGLRRSFAAWRGYSYLRAIMDHGVDTGGATGGDEASEHTDEKG